MRSKAGIVCMVTGAVLILSALFLIFCSIEENEQAGKSRDRVLQQMEKEIENKNIWNDTTGDLAEKVKNIEIDGNYYIGYLSLPVLGLELPVMKEWDYERLKIAPCRQCGTSQDDNLVIAGHNYENHFGKLSLLKNGDQVWFTDVNGSVNTYAVGAVEILNPDQVDEMKNSEWDLTLYTCTPSGSQRLTIRCERCEVE